MHTNSRDNLLRNYTLHNKQLFNVTVHGNQPYVVKTENSDNFVHQENLHFKITCMDYVIVPRVAKGSYTRNYKYFVS